MSAIVNAVDELSQMYIQSVVKENAKNTVESFFNKEIEELSEYVCIEYLYENDAKFK